MNPAVGASRFYHCETNIVLPINLKISPMSYRKVLWFAIQFQYLIRFRSPVMKEMKSNFQMLSQINLNINQLNQLTYNLWFN